MQLNTYKSFGCIYSYMPKFNDNWAKLLLKLDHEWVISSHKTMGVIIYSCQNLWHSRKTGCLADRLIPRKRRCHQGDSPGIHRRQCLQWIPGLSPWWPFHLSVLTYPKWLQGMTSAQIPWQLVISIYCQWSVDNIQIHWWNLAKHYSTS